MATLGTDSTRPGRHRNKTASKLLSTPFYSHMTWCVASVHMPRKLQTCRKFESFRGQNLDYRKFPQKCVTCDTPNSALDRMIYKLVEEITTNQAVLDLSETPIEVFLQQSC